MPVDVHEEWRRKVDLGDYDDGKQKYVYEESGYGRKVSRIIRYPRSSMIPVFSRSVTLAHALEDAAGAALLRKKTKTELRAMWKVKSQTPHLPRPRAFPNPRPRSSDPDPVNPRLSAAAESTNTELTSCHFAFLVLPAFRPGRAYTLAAKTAFALFLPGPAPHSPPPCRSMDQS